MSVPRRCRVDLMTAAELAIREAIVEVEKCGADERLTDAVVLLSAAQDSVADFHDGLEVRRSVTVKRSAQALDGVRA